MMKLWILTFILLPFTVFADTKIIEQYKFYTVSPSTKDYLLASLNLKSPIRESGHTYHGNTAYQLRIRFWWAKSNGQCKLANIKTVLKLKYTLPKLKTTQGSVLAVWSKWYPHLYAHEQGHGRLAKKAAENVDMQLLAMAMNSDCNLLKEQAQLIAQKAILKLKQSFKDYDLKTNHGQTQGAWIYAYL